MRRIGKNPDRDFSAGYGQSQPEMDRRGSDMEQDLKQLACDPESWGKPLSYVELLSDPTVQSRIARLIVQSAIKRSRHSRW
jgi:hypothetical protein